MLNSKAPLWPQHRGIVLAARDEDALAGAWICARQLRRLGCGLPVQVWHPGSLDPNWAEWFQPFGVQCADARATTQSLPRGPLDGADLQLRALWHSPFREVLLLDAATLPVASPEALFDSPQFQAAGALFWTDPAASVVSPSQCLLDKARHKPALRRALAAAGPSGQASAADRLLAAWRSSKSPWASPAKASVARPGFVVHFDTQGRRLFQERRPFPWALRGSNPPIPGFFQELHCRKFLAQLRRLADAPDRWHLPPGSPRLARRLKISYCCACAGRLDDLKRTLSRNLAASAALNAEWVLLNDSDGPLDVWIRSKWPGAIDSGRLVYARLDGCARNTAHARNLAFRLASGDILCGLDAADRIPAELTRSLAGLFASREKTVARVVAPGSGSRIALPRHWFHRLGGYDESLAGGPGCEEEDLFRRACGLGLAHGTGQTAETGAWRANARAGWARGTARVNFLAARSLEFGPAPARAARRARPCLVTVASQPIRGFHEFLRTARQHGMDPVVLGAGEPYGGNTAKVRILKQFLETEAARSSHVLFCDAYDVLFAGGFDEILEQFETFGAPAVFSAECHCWPDADLAPEYPPSATRYRFLNSGVWIARTEAAHDLFQRFHLPALRDNQSDQRLFTRLLLEGAALTLDRDCRIAQSLNASEADIEWRQGRIVNRLTGQAPLIFHGNGGADLSAVRSWLGLGS